jgi:NAD(P)H-dependent flavin oxidoreductase YrpB (nitropropane dioxygenase family)
MGLRDLPSLRIGELLAEIPLVQGGMGVGISLSGLASAVANEGGIGVISATGIGLLESDFDNNYHASNLRSLEKVVKKAKEMTKGIIGVNILMALTDCFDLAQVAADAGADILFLGAGLPLKLPEKLFSDRPGRGPIKIIPIVSSARAANIIFRSWIKNHGKLPDALVVEGPEAGGHLGLKKNQLDDPSYALDKLLPEVLDAVKPYEEKYSVDIPVIAAGGIYSGADIKKYMDLGANGVQMGTRFVATEECDASPIFKQAYIDCAEEDIIIINSPVGLPGRTIRNKFLDDVSEGKKKPFTCPWKCLHTCNFVDAPYCIATALVQAQRGNFSDGFSFAGTNAYRVDKIVTVKELIRTLSEEYDSAV